MKEKKKLNQNKTLTEVATSHKNSYKLNAKTLLISKTVQS